MSGPHGNRWEALIGSKNDLVNLVRDVLGKADIENLHLSPGESSWRDTHPNEPEWSMVAWPKTKARIAMILRSRASCDTISVASFFPLLDSGEKARLKLLRIDEDEQFGEADLSFLRNDGRNLVVFDPLYCLHRADLQPGQEYDFELAGLAYGLRKHASSMPIDRGPLLEIRRKQVAEEDPNADVSKITSVDVSFEDCRILNQGDDRIDNDAEFFFKVDGVEWFSMDDIEICRVTGFAEHADDGVPLRVAIYASQFVLKDYRPQIGDLVTGLAWLQALHLCVADPLLKVSDFMNLSFSRMLCRKAGVEYTCESLALFALINALSVMADWTVERMDAEASRANTVRFDIKKEDKSVSVFAKSCISGHGPPAKFTKAEKQQLCPSGKNGVFIVAKCEDAGTFYKITYIGRKSLERHTGPLRLFEYVSKKEFAASARPEDSVPEEG